MNTASSYSSLLKQKSQTMIDMAIMLENSGKNNSQPKMVEFGSNFGNPHQNHNTVTSGVNSNNGTQTNILIQRASSSEIQQPSIQ